VLHQPFADHDVADAELRVDAAGSAGEDQRAAIEPVEQQRRRERRPDLADAAFGQHHATSVERAVCNFRAGPLVVATIVEGGRQQPHLLRQRAENPERA
jgi:hypothetical protein